MKQPPTKQSRVNIGTYFLAKNSGLFRPGAEFMLATVPQKRSKRAYENSEPGGMMLSARHTNRTRRGQ